MPRDPRLQAVLRRDAARDGDFVYGVRTTAVYCRPGCPSRTPRPEHVRLFASATDAAREGYRPCKRCRPDAPAPDGILATCEYIRRHLHERLTLARIAPSSGWSPFHLQRVFRERLGVSPLRYAQRLRFERLGRHLRDGLRVTPALQHAGLGSGGPLYRGRPLGMSASRARAGGAGLRIAYDLVPSPLGRLCVAATPLGICCVEFGLGPAGLRERFPRAEIVRDPRLLRFAARRLRELLDGRLLDPGLPLDVRATAFQARVWTELRAIPAGRTRTYRDLARSLGRPSASRAVARACASNPVAVLVPCHRVVGSDGGLRGYRWGLDRKRALLGREAR